MAKPLLEISIEPAELVFYGIAPGKVHRAELTLKNIGTVPVLVPTELVANASDPEWITKELLLAVQNSPETDALQTMGAFVQRVKNYLSQQVQVSIQKGGQKILPKQSQSITLELKLPAKTKDIFYLEGDVDILNESVFFCIGE